MGQDWSIQTAIIASDVLRGIEIRSLKTSFTVEYMKLGFENTIVYVARTHQLNDAVMNLALHQHVGDSPDVRLVDSFNSSANNALLDATCPSLRLGLVPANFDRVY